MRLVYALEILIIKKHFLSQKLQFREMLHQSASHRVTELFRKSDDVPQKLSLCRAFIYVRVFTGVELEVPSE